MEGIYYEDSFPDPKTDPDSLFFIEIDKDRCIGCDTCLDYCPTGVIWGDFAEPHEIRFRELCINCGQCLTHCLENAIYESQSWVRKVDEMLADKSKKVIAMPAPAVRYTCGCVATFCCVWSCAAGGCTAVCLRNTCCAAIRGV